MITHITRNLEYCFQPHISFNVVVKELSKASISYGYEGRKELGNPFLKKKKYIDIYNGYNIYMHI